MWLLSGFRGVNYIKHLSLAAAVMIVSSVSALISTVGIAFLLDHTGHAMSWFSNTFLLFGLYAAPACCIMLSSCILAKKLFYKVSFYNLPFHILLCFLYGTWYMLWYFCSLDLLIISFSLTGSTTLTASCVRYNCSRSTLHGCQTQCSDFLITSLGPNNDSTHSHMLLLLTWN